MPASPTLAIRPFLSRRVLCVMMVLVVTVVMFVWGLSVFVYSTSLPLSLTEVRYHVARSILYSHHHQQPDEVDNLAPHYHHHHYYLPPDNLTQSYLMPLEALQEPSSRPSSTPLKTILLWNTFFGMTHYEFGLGREPFVRAGCPETRCWVTTDRSVLSRPDPASVHALIWHAFNSDTSFPAQRSPETRYIFFSMESPEILRRFWVDLTPYSHTFNWTFTYRRDSDIVLPYGEVMKLEHRDIGWRDINFAEGKTKLIAWVASNCRTSSGRESLVRQLQQYVPVDTYGRCGRMGCGSSRAWGCYQMLNQHYKFYLAFENSLCRDYITEKVYNILELNVVPVVYGGVDYKRFLPPNSYIDALDYPDVKTLAAHLSYLDSNTTAFNQYFKWKEEYTVLTRWGVRARGWCSLCQRLHQDDITSTTHHHQDHTTTTTHHHHYSSYPNLHQWYVEKSHCIDAANTMT